ncbi:monooxygenase [Sphingobacterium psychroaquaticum]|uniref:FAD-dependent monooxygenase n=1 Tax=Sphingobacterium psychroaquaticum TaxID=561061 RepID=UPI00106C0BAB|nr:FAD-dependent monooxygenase [Sphingobacterium psychroaquaticum]QBQ42323.1 monooxygenase [Sphingobacterium psychroaquaticum]
MKARFAIVGGGIAGLTAAIGLRKLGYEPIIYERTPVLKGIGAGFGLAANAMHAFDLLGLRQGVEKIGHFLSSYAILDQKGRVIAAPDTAEIAKNFQQLNFAIHRADLHRFLIDQLPPETILLGKEALNLEQNKDGIVLHFADGQKVEAEYLLITDGVRSKLRQQLIPQSAPRYSGYTCWRAVIDNTDINLKEGSETWGALGRFGMTPLVNDKIYWYACINASENNPTYAAYKIADLQRHFRSYHTDIQTLLKNTQDEQLLWNDIIDIKPLDTLAYNRVLLLGDAGHATTPNMGQGACQAIEDAVVLMDELKTNPAIETVFQHVNERRLHRTRYITNTSWQIGKVAQWENRNLIAVRNFFMRNLPARFMQSKLQQLLSEDFMTINKRR